MAERGGKRGESPDPVRHGTLAQDVRVTGEEPDDSRYSRTRVTTETRRLYRPDSGSRSPPRRPPRVHKPYKKAMTASSAIKMRPDERATPGQFALESESLLAKEARTVQQGASKMVTDALDQMINKNNILSKECEMYRRRQTEYEQINDALRELLDEILALCQHYATECNVEEGIWTERIDMDAIPDFLERLVEHLDRQSKAMGAEYVELIKKVEDFGRQIESKDQDLDAIRGQLDDEKAILERKLREKERLVRQLEEELDVLNRKLSELRDQTSGERTRRKRDVDDVQATIEMLRRELEEAKKNAIKARDEAEQLIHELRSELNQKNRRIAELESRRGGFSSQIEDIREELNRALKELQGLKEERQRIIQVIKDSLHDSLADRLGLKADIGKNEKIHDFLDHILKTLIDEIKKAWSIVGHKEAENKELKKGSDDYKKDLTDKFRKEYEQYANAVKADADKAMRMVQDLRAQLANANREKDRLVRQMNVDTEKYDNLLTECTIKYEGDKKQWDVLRGQFEKQLASLMEELKQYQKEVDVARRKADEISRLLQEKDELLLRLKADAENTQADLSAKVKGLEKEIVALRGQLVKERGENERKEMELRRNLDKTQRQLDQLQKMYNSMDTGASDLKAQAKELERMLFDERKKLKELLEERDELRKRCERIWFDQEKAVKELASTKVQLEKEKSYCEDLKRRIVNIEAAAPQAAGTAGATKCADRIRALEGEIVALRKQATLTSSQLGDMQDALHLAKRNENDLKTKLEEKAVENEQLGKELASLRDKLKTAQHEGAKSVAERNKLLADANELRYQLSRVQGDNERIREQLRGLESSFNYKPPGGVISSPSPKHVIIRRYRSVSPTGYASARSASADESMVQAEVQRFDSDRQPSGSDYEAKRNQQLIADMDAFFSGTELIDAVKDAQMEIYRASEKLNQIQTTSGGAPSMQKHRSELQEVYNKLTQLRTRMEDLHLKEGEDGAKAALKTITADAVALSERLDHILTAPLKPSKSQRSTTDPSDSSRTPRSGASFQTQVSFSDTSSEQGTPQSGKQVQVSPDSRQSTDIPVEAAAKPEYYSLPASPSPSKER